MVTMVVGWSRDCRGEIPKMPKAPNKEQRPFSLCRAQASLSLLLISFSLSLSLSLSLSSFSLSPHTLCCVVFSLSLSSIASIEATLLG
ncbi:hypothetical protein RIF29_17688 [Crotalaria pallida]|uniref:Uncharacterized protein n=1 Tax=Crotalaria pallida TaxID=3830 RepID=A0AAN9FJT5_CROPI